MHVFLYHGHHECECYDGFRVDGCDGQSSSAMIMYELDPSASIVVTIDSAEYPELFRFVTVGFLLDPSTSDKKFNARRA